MSQQMQVTVPAGVSPGMLFQVNTPAGPMQVTCPNGATAGSSMVVNVPMAPVVVEAVAMPLTDQPAVMVAPQPMQMMVQPTGAMPMAHTMHRELHKVPLDLGNKVPDEPPPLLAALSGTDWSLVVQHINEHQRTNGFSNCPVAEAGLYYTCCCCCLCLPCFVLIGNYDTRQEKFKEVRVPEINTRIAAKSMRCEFTEVNHQEYLIFYGP